MDKAIEFERPRGGEFYARMKPLLDKPDQAQALALLLGQGRSRGAAWLAWSGDNEAALEALRGPLMQPGSRYGVLWAIWEPGLAGVRKLPGFKQLMRDIGLVEYWRKYGWGDYCKPTTGDDFECH